MINEKDNYISGRRTISTFSYFFIKPTNAGMSTPKYVPHQHTKLQIHYLDRGPIDISSFRCGLALRSHQNCISNCNPQILREGPRGKCLDHGSGFPHAVLMIVREVLTSFDGFKRGSFSCALHSLLPPCEEDACLPYCHDCKFPEASPVMLNCESIKPLLFINYQVSHMSLLAV